MSALRHVVERFTQGHLLPHSSDLGRIFEQMMDDTIARAISFNSTVADGAFNLAYEAIVGLKTGEPHHYEALTRFSEGESPAETIRFAEHMGLAQSFDFAVVVKALSEIEANSAISAPVAINISGRTLGSATSLAMLVGLLGKKRTTASARLLIEITESAEITDVGEADKAIQQLRRMGYKVGIDDFGAGAASLSYLHGFTIDFVKVDGTLIASIGQSSRANAFLRSIVASCRELKVETIAEWIDSAEKLKHCIDIGFDYGQGRHFGPALMNLAEANEGSGSFRRDSETSRVRRLSRSTLTR
jgi:EAL domain-containing protein (putative c-di-GMP-specific phosphodiesterase class I)